MMLVLALGATANASTLWYNGDADGISSYVNQFDSNSRQILLNDFNVTGPGWTIQSVWSNNIWTNGAPSSTDATWQIRANMPTGTLIASGDSPATLTPTGFSPFGFTEYQVLVTGLNVALSPGTYWLAVYPDNSNGGEVGNDTTSGANAVGTPGGNNGNLFFTSDDANFFGAPLDTSAGVGGVVGISAPEPSSLVLLAAASTLLIGYRKRAGRE
jgi:hypothetical protein